MHTYCPRGKNKTKQDPMPLRVSGIIEFRGRTSDAINQRLIEPQMFIEHLSCALNIQHVQWTFCIVFNELTYSSIDLQAILSPTTLCLILVIVFIMASKCEALGASSAICKGARSFVIKSLARSYESLRPASTWRPRLYLLIFLLNSDIMRSMKGSLVYVYAINNN